MRRPGEVLGRHANEAVGIVVLVTVVLFTLAALQSGRLRNWFDPGAELRVLLPASGLLGLAEGASVDILGTPAGQVETIVFGRGTGDDALHARVRIRSDMLDFVRDDSTVTIRKRFGVAGDSYLDISRGDGAPLDWTYAVLEASADRAPTDLMGELVTELRDVALPMLDSAETAIESIARISGDLSDPQGDLFGAVASLRDVAEGLQRGEGAVGKLLKDDALFEQLQSTLVEVNVSVAALAPLLDAVRARVDETEPVIGELQRGAASVAAIGTDLRRQVRALPALVAQAERTLSSLDAVLRDLRRTTPELPRVTRGIAESSENLAPLLAQTQATAEELEALVAQLRASWILGGDGGAPQRARERISPLRVSP